MTSTVLPYSNAQLTRVEGGGFTEDFDLSDAADTTRWAGTADAFLGERVLTEVDGERVDEIKRARFWFAASVVTGVQRGDTITYIHKGSTYIRRVRDIEDLEVVGIVRLYFEDE